MSKFFVAFMFTFLLVGCSTYSIQTDYDREFDFNSLSTFTVLYSKKNDFKDFTRDRINKILAKYFQDRGYISVSKKDADFFILFHLDTKTRSEVETTYESMMITPILYYDNDNKLFLHQLINPFPLFAEPLFTKHSRIYDYEEGQLNIEILDVKTNTIVWQALVQDDISDMKDIKQIEKIVKKLFNGLFKK